MSLDVSQDVTLINFPLRGNFSKRVFDVFFSLAALVVTAPLLFLIALTVRCSSRGHVIYSHERIGQRGKPFRCYKFRTMYPDADLRLQEMLAHHPELRKEWEETHKLKNDPRITPIGRWLRKLSLDEFPQFLNVLKGDLSVVGPRPITRTELKKYQVFQGLSVLEIKPGITGLWQVSGRNNTTYEERIALDLQYVKKQNFLFDLKLILKTFPAMCSRRGAY
jgi:exopolysaccharide production protein ExoY